MATLLGGQCMFFRMRSHDLENKDQERMGCLICFGYILMLVRPIQKLPQFCDMLPFVSNTCTINAGLHSIVHNLHHLN